MPRVSWSFRTVGTGAQNILVADRTLGNIDSLAWIADSFTINGAVGITGALNATSYGGIAEANLVNKSATETIAGAWTFSNIAAATFSGNIIQTGLVSVTTVVGANENLAPTGHATASIFRIATTAGGNNNINGIAGGVDGRRVLLINTGPSSSFVLVNEVPGSTAANRFAVPTTGVIVDLNEAVEIFYDGISNRWRAIE